MKLIETTAELLPFIAGEDGIYKMIERAGRTCYKSIDKMTDDSAKPFVERMIKSGHTAMLEHGTVYLAIPYTDSDTLSHYRGYAGQYNEIEFTLNLLCTGSLSCTLLFSKEYRTISSSFS